MLVVRIQCSVAASVIRQTVRTLSNLSSDILPAASSEDLPRPMYVYDVLDDEGAVCGLFEIIQKITAEPLTKHPETGQTLRMKMSAPFVGRKANNPLPKADISNRNLGKLGFTKYQKSPKGGYDRVAGDGPDLGK